MFGDNVKRIVLQILLGLGGLLMFFRFGGPGIDFRTYGTGPFWQPLVTGRKNGHPTFGC
jgi:hypothetical protein